MGFSRFWTLKKKAPDKPLSGPVLQLEAVSILELTEDGMAFIWPVQPDRGELCHYCRKYQNVPEHVFEDKAYRNTHCQVPENSPYPCAFAAVENPDHQDLDSYLRDGDCKDAGGYFLGLNQFLQGHNYAEQDFEIYPLGALEGIASARILWDSHNLMIME